MGWIRKDKTNASSGTIKIEEPFEGLFHRSRFLCDHLDLAVLRYSSVAKCSRQNPKVERERGIPMGGTNANTWDWFNICSRPPSSTVVSRLGRRGRKPKEKSFSSAVNAIISEAQALARLTSQIASSPPRKKNQISQVPWAPSEVSSQSGAFLGKALAFQS